MLHPASAKRRKRSETKLNLVPILDAVFIFIFFLLASSQFVKMFEVVSDVPTVSDAPPEPPKKNEKPLNLTLRVKSNELNVYTGNPSKLQKSFKKVNGEYDLDGLHDYLVFLKSKNLKEEMIVFEPLKSLDYQIVINMMDAVRTMRFDDPKLYKLDESGNQIQLKTLFSEIIFGNLE